MHPPHRSWRWHLAARQVAGPSRAQVPQILWMNDTTITQSSASGSLRAVPFLWPGLADRGSVYGSLRAGAATSVLAKVAAPGTTRVGNPNGSGILQFSSVNANRRGPLSQPSGAGALPPCSTRGQLGDP